jgi:hypothetical protein
MRAITLCFCWIALFGDAALITNLVGLNSRKTGIWFVYLLNNIVTNILVISTKHFHESMDKFLSGMKHWQNKCTAYRQICFLLWLLIYLHFLIQSDAIGQKITHQHQRLEAESNYKDTRPCILKLLLLRDCTHIAVTSAAQYDIRQGQSHPVVIVTSTFLEEEKYESVLQ